MGLMLPNQTFVDYCSKRIQLWEGCTQFICTLKISKTQNNATVIVVSASSDSLFSDSEDMSCMHLNEIGRPLANDAGVRAM